MHVQRNFPYGDHGDHPVSVSQLNDTFHETSNIFIHYILDRSRQTGPKLSRIIEKVRTTRITTILQHMTTYPVRYTHLISTDYVYHIVLEYV